MTEEEFQRIKRDPAVMERLIREHNEFMASQGPLPVHAPINGYERPDDTLASPVRDIAAEHAEGSAKLASAIKDMRAGRDPKSPRNMIWRGTHGGSTKRGWYIREQEAEPTYVDRQPCGRCGVRFDMHKDHGCKVFARAVAA